MSGTAEVECIVSLESVFKIFNGGAHPTAAVQNVTLKAKPGEMTLLLGPSGSGKTTLLTLMAGLSRPTSGRIRLYGREVINYSSRELQRLRAEKIGFIFQTFLLIDTLTVLENIEIVLRFSGCRRRERRARAWTLLRKFQIGHLARKFPGTLSQGEKQRVAVARAMANDAQMIIADEPTGCLETRQGMDIIRLLRDQAVEGKKCVIIASHDLRLAEYADHIFRMEDGMVRSEDRSGDPILCRRSSPGLEATS